MSSVAPALVATSRPRPLVLATVAVAVIAAVGISTRRSDPAPAGPAAAPEASAEVPELPRAEEQRGPGVDDGIVPNGTSVFDDRYPAVTRLDGTLLAALRRSANEAQRDRVTLVVDSGWRSPAYQAQLLREATAKYGSATEAARWVATPETSAHASGDAVDIGPPAAAAWLAAHGAAHGLCRVYRNEPWHFELRPDAARHGCPRPYADASHDPRLRR